MTYKNGPLYVCYSIRGTHTTGDFSPSPDGSHLLLSSVAPQRCDRGLSCLPHTMLFVHPVHVKENKIGPEVLNLMEMIPPTTSHCGTSWWHYIVYTHFPIRR